MTDIRQPPGSVTGGGRTWAIVLASCIGQFLVVLDVSVVNIGLPSMRDDLGLGGSAMQWVVNAYALTFAGFLLLGGRASDLFGRRNVYLLGLGLFTAASLVGGLAQNGGTLIAARAVQGVGAAALAPVTLSLLTSTFAEGPARTRAIAAWTAVGAAGGAAGGLIGGALTDYTSWRWVLLINVPIGLAVGAVVLGWLREPAGTRARPRLDLPGAVLVTAGVAGLAYGVSRSETDGWTSRSALLLMLGGLVTLAAFVAVEARSAQPLMPLRLFRIRSVAVGNVVMLVSMSGSFAMWYFLTLYMQNVLDYSAVRTGLSFLPHTAAIILGSQLAPRLMARFGSRTMAMAGGLLMAGGFLWQSAALTADGTFVTAVLGPALPMAAGAALMLTPLTDTATSGASAQDAGGVAGLINTSRQMGAVLGLSVLSAVAASGAAGEPGAGAAALADGYGRAFLTAGLVVTAATVLVPLLPRPRRAADGPHDEADTGRHPHPHEAPAPSATA
ncbi:MFS transporter [Streptomyces sp. MP131-18]|uniref:MFS transporter n=1 Tax=Streptomyces sp. MP131-18 TaxID=1857892 RepID=UPI0009D5A79E|nr:MFS transporter [Streptomyces sp. MP131-18]ONK11922.1 Spectinomycin tetracycline efflux pump [Streptomyces sp. MP131-18]